MKQNTDFIFVAKADINEGLTTGQVSKVAIWFTKSYIFMVPFSGINIWELSDNKFDNSKSFIEAVNASIETVTVTEFEQKMIDSLPNERVYKVDALAKLSVQVGFFIFGGIHIKKAGEQVQALNVQPKSVRAAIKHFYQKS
jgi:hypothetical protein